jgi:hypothetical protein
LEFIEGLTPLLANILQGADRRVSANLQGRRWARRLGVALEMCNKETVAPKVRDRLLVLRRVKALSQRGHADTPVSSGSGD